VSGDSVAVFCPPSARPNSESTDPVNPTMQWYKILAIVIGSFLGVYIGFLLLVAFEYPQRQ
jgi:formate-dependent nitrite reductase membrane component NrfD